MSNLKIDSITPEYGNNYKKGYIGFTYNKDSVISKGIAYITRWARIDDVKVSHALVVSGENECIEAVGEGVGRNKLDHYFDNPSCQIFFRKPKGLTEAIADNIVAKAAEEVGKGYDSKLIIAQALSNNRFGKMLNNVFGNKLEEMASSLLDDDNKWICSELAAYTLDEQEAYRDKGILNDPNNTIDPQELFGDPIIFKEWKN